MFKNVKESLTACKKIVCCYHEDLDGATAAAIIYLVSGEVNTPVEFYRVQYGNPVPTFEQNKDTVVFVVDFCFKPEEVTALREHNARVFIMDHHESSFKMAEIHPDTYFDLSRSGALITYSFYMESFIQNPYPRIDLVTLRKYVKLVNDYDLFHHVLENTKPFIAFINGGYDIHNLTDYKQLLIGTSFAFEEIIEKGRELRKKIDDFIERFFTEKRFAVTELHGVRVAVMPGLGKDVKDELHHEVIARGFADCTISHGVNTRDRKVTFSMRADNGVRVNDICAIYGGGGHPNAGGFGMEYDEGFEFLKKLYQSVPM